MRVASDYLTPPEAGRLLRVKPERIIALIRSGELRAVNVATSLSGRPRYRIARADLDAWLDRRAAASVATPQLRRRRRRAQRPEGWVAYYNMAGGDR